MSTPDRDLLTIAREVLDAVKVMDATPGTLYLDGPTHEHERAASSILDAAPDLARAVVAAADLADELREVAHESYLYCKDDAGDAYQDAADRITAALNGDPDD